MILSNIYTSSGCNRSAHAADWCGDGSICFAAGNSVSIFCVSDNDDNPTKINGIWCSHNKAVTSVRWARDLVGKTINTFISTSADNTAAIVFDPENADCLKKITLRGHENVVSIADCILSNSNQCQKNFFNVFTAVTASVDSTVRIWTHSSQIDKTNEAECIDIINLGSGFALDVRLAWIADSLLLACAVDDRRIHLFVKSSEADALTKVHVISGHEDWVRALDFCWHGGKLLLASASQDTFVRIHEMSVKPKLIGRRDTTSRVIETEESKFPVGTSTVGIRLQTVLTGHEGWVYGACFFVSEEGVRLLTSSMDKTLVVWMMEDNLWIEKARLGEVGGNTLGFYGGKFSSDGRNVMAHGYQGSFHIWRLMKDDNWEPTVVVGGHLGQVTDISWAPSGNYLLSVGADQTTRLHAPWRLGAQSTWHEIARPQVHGHDMSCIATLSDTSFVSGAEEKVLRAFTAPANFIHNFGRICKTELTVANQSLPEGAAVPALGLSNKPVFSDTNSDGEIEMYFSALHLSRPPTEENLMQNTLWPEVQKLYGHGYEVHCVAASGDGAFIASACHATTQDHAAVIIWETRTWNELQRLSYHRLTVTQMAFSPQGSHLVTVSRDRRWCLYRQNNETGLFEAHASGEKSLHTRIIWCCAWSQDGAVFGTGSRDGVICLWDPQSGSCVASTKIEDSVTALAFSHLQDQIILLAGTDSGSIVVLDWTEQTLSTRQRVAAHSSTVNRILFQPEAPDVFASCSKDQSLKIFSVAASL